MIGTDVSLADRDRIAAQCSISAPAFAFINGGAGDLTARDQNRAAWRGVKVQHRHPADVSAVDVSAPMFGKAAAIPVGIAPIGLANSLTPCADNTKGEGADLAIANACKKAGIPMVVSTFSSTDLTKLKATGADLVFQLYWRPKADDQTKVLNAAIAAGVTSIVVTVDTPLRAGSNEEAVTGFNPTCTSAECPDKEPPKAEITGGNTEIATNVTVADITALVTEMEAKNPKVSVYVKGVLDPDVAEQLVKDSKVKGLIVSNHSGRQLDSAPSTAEAFVEIKKKIGLIDPKPDPMPELYVDSGIRTGWDVLRALSLGAQGVLIGRQAFYNVAAGGQDRLDAYLARVKKELDTAMKSAGAPTTTSVPPQKDGG